MPNPNETNVEYVDMVGVSVVNTAHDGYRRAGFVLALGENILPPVTFQRLRSLETDPRLSVSVIAAATDDLPPRGLANTELPDVVANISPLSGTQPTQTASQSTSVNVDVIDPDITRYRPTIIIADDNFTKAKGNARGSWEQQRSMAHATTATVTVHDWFNQRGQLWTPNQLVTVKATAAGLSDRDLLITTVTFDLTQDGGTVTELELMPREGFEEPAEPDAKTGSVSDGIWR